MNVTPTGFKGLFEIRLPVFKDNRGSFIKNFHTAEFEKNNLETRFREDFFTQSKKRVLRGLHFQTPPADQIKIVYCISGKILDAVVDLRAGSPNYGQAHTLEMSGESGLALYIPSGFAHGFYTLSEEGATIGYKVTYEHSPECDRGILWNSVPVKWKDEQPILSARDARLPPLSDFRSPFRYD